MLLCHQTCCVKLTCLFLVGKREGAKRDTERKCGKICPQFNYVDICACTFFFFEK